MADPFDAAELHKRLVAAGLPISGCNSKGVVFWSALPTAEQEAKAEQIKAQLQVEIPDPMTWRVQREESERQRIRALLGKLESGHPLLPQEQQEVLVFLLRRMIEGYRV